MYSDLKAVKLIFPPGASGWQVDALDNDELARRRGIAADTSLCFSIRQERQTSHKALEMHLRIGIDSLKELINKGETVKYLRF